MPRDEHFTPAPTFAEAIRRLATDPGLTDLRRRDLISSLVSAARLIGLPADAVPLDPVFLRPRLMAVHPLQAGISKARLANIRSAARAVLKRFRLAGNGRDAVPLGPAWKVALDRVPDRFVRLRLFRLARFCAARGIDPAGVTATTFQALREDAARTTIGGSARHSMRAILRAWNRAAGTVPDWPGQTVVLPPHNLLYGLPMTSFPVSFTEDVERWVALVDGSRLLADEGPLRPLRASTIEGHRSRIGLAASALVRTGRSPESIRTLADLVEPDAAKAILRFHLERAGGKATGFVNNVASLLLAIARHHVHADDATITALRRLVSKTHPEAKGLTTTNRQRLAQFDDERNVARLLHLPQSLMRRAEQERRPMAERARLALFAVAIELLLHCPIRLGNLVRLDLDRHFVRTGAGRRAAVHLRIDGGEVKNREPIEFALPRELVQMIDRYVARFRPAFAVDGQAWLFPSPTGGCRRQQAFASALTDLVWQETGLRISTHTFRHIGAKLYLDASPGDYETVRRVLGHSSIDTTTSAYTGLETVRAGRHFDRNVLRLRKETALLARADARRRR